MNRSRNSFDAVLFRELLKSERKKSAYFVRMAGLAIVLVAAIMFLNQEYFQSLGDARGVRYWLLLVPGLLMLHEAACVRLLDRSSGRGAAWLGVFNALLEPTAVTAWLMAEGSIFRPGAMFDSPAAYAYLMIVMLSALRLSWRLCVLTALTAGVEYIALAAWHWPALREAFQEKAFLFLPIHGVRSGLILFSGVIAAFVAREVRKGVEESLRTMDERDFVVRIFGRYLTDEVVDAILSSPEGLALGGRKRVVTLMMTDLRGFSTLAEHLPPESIVAMLNNYLAAMTEIIVRHKGTIDEFIGDAILAIFGAPFSAEDDAERAAACAIQMQLAMDGVNEWNARNGLPRLEMGVGIHTGQAVVGNIGSEKRSKYGVVGSAVNLTSRIESYTVGGQILASAASVAACGERLRVGARRQVRPKGSAAPLEICEVTGLAGDPALQLPARLDRLTPLEPALPVRFVVVEGKDTSGPPLEGALLELSEKGARLWTSSPLAPFASLRLELKRPGSDVASCHVLGKIVEEAASVSLVWFTALEPGALEFIKCLLENV